MIEWTKKIGPLEPTRYDNIEVDKNMPPSWKQLLDEAKREKQDR